MNTHIYIEHEDHATLEDQAGNVIDGITFSSAPLKYLDPDEQRCFAAGWAMEQLVSDVPMRIALNAVYSTRGVVG